MRGKGPMCGSDNITTRITPAYAGKRTLFFVHYANSRDHPRICGEKVIFQRLFVGFLGSPPHMRGKD